MPGGDEEGAGLGRFVAAQGPVWEAVRRELAEGRKRTHWIWFVFPQVAGLGRSDMARRYALGSLGEARAYLAHPLLGPRLAECAALALAAPAGRSARDVFGEPDDLKLRSCLTLFSRAAPGPEGAVFRTALARSFGGSEDAATVERLAAAAAGDAGR